jgi:ApaG protein
VQTQYLESQSDPEEKRYVFAYTITIRNHGSVGAFVDASLADHRRGRQSSRSAKASSVSSHLAPGAAFRYSSWCGARNRTRSMQGSYGMQGDDGTVFEAPIAPFRLAMPALH